MLDLSLTLSKAEEAQRLNASQRRLAARRLALGGKPGTAEPGPPVCVLFEGWDMLKRTDDDLASWQLVEGDSKRFARVKVIETVNRQIKLGMRERGFERALALTEEQVAG